MDQFSRSHTSHFFTTTAPASDLARVNHHHDQMDDSKLKDSSLNATVGQSLISPVQIGKRDHADTATMTD
jgi:hypothetical protein